MDDYYKLLDIEETATEGEIKRAYFKKARQYPPERFPEEFKALRAAYETLSHPDKREDYDKRSTEQSSLPEAAADLLAQAANARRMEFYDDAEALLKTACELFPEQHLPKRELAGLYTEQGKSGKAASVWEELCKDSPENAEYAAALAKTYFDRGWRKKAIAELERSLRLNDKSYSVWTGLIRWRFDGGEWYEAREACYKAAEIAKDLGEDGFVLYLSMSSLIVKYDDSLAEEYLQKAAAMLKANPGFSKDRAEFIVIRTLDSIMANGKAMLFPYIREMAAMLGRVTDDSQRALDRAALMYDVITLPDKGYSTIFYELFVTLDESDDSTDDKCVIASMEIHILMDIDAFRSELLRLKREFPVLYALHAKFFDDALASRAPQRLIDKRLKFLDKHGMAPAYFDDDFETETIEQEPFRRETAQVGRNDPCPCGSGKKYKKCCGA